MSRTPGSRVALRLSAVGVLWLVCVLALLATAINYGNNVVFAMAFLLLALWLQAAWHCRRHVQNLQVHWRAPLPVFAGTVLRCDACVLQAQPGAALWVQGRVRAPHETIYAARHGESVCTWAEPEQARGEHCVQGLQLASNWPLGLWSARRPLPPLTALVYPRPAGHNELGATAPVAARQLSAATEFQDLRRYAAGDAPQRINWRAFARRDELLVSRFGGEHGGSAVWLDFTHCAGDMEQRLSQLTQWILAAEHTTLEYGLRLPGMQVPPSLGRSHRSQCLRHLALMKGTA